MIFEYQNKGPENHTTGKLEFLNSKGFGKWKWRKGRLFVNKYHFLWISRQMRIYHKWPFGNIPRNKALPVNSPAFKQNILYLNKKQLGFLKKSLTINNRKNYFWSTIKQRKKFEDTRVSFSWGFQTIVINRHVRPCYKFAKLLTVLFCLPLLH